MSLFKRLFGKKSNEGKEAKMPPKEQSQAASQENAQRPSDQQETESGSRVFRNRH